MLKNIIPNKWIRLVIGLLVAAGGVLLYVNTQFPVSILGLLIVAVGAFVTPTYKELFNRGK